MKRSKAWKKGLRRIIMGFVICSMMIPGLTSVVNATAQAGEIRWDFIEGKEGANVYKEGTDSVSLSSSNGMLQINATSVTENKPAGFYLTNSFTIDDDVHQYIVIKADLPANISKIAAYLYDTNTKTGYMYGWANNDNSIQAGITTGTNLYALRLSEGHETSGGPNVQVADGTYNKLEIRFYCNAALTDQVISVDYVSIGGYNKDAILCNGTDASTSVVGEDEKPALISGLNIGGKSYALNETANGYTVCGMQTGYGSLETASVTATAAGWMITNMATDVTALANHKIVDATVTATDGAVTKTANYRYVFSATEIRWDFIEGTEGANVYKEGTDSVSLSSSNGMLQVNATGVTVNKPAGFYLTNSFTIDDDVHQYIVIKADLPANISKIVAYLYDTNTQANYMYGWANNDNSIQAGITTGTNLYALRLSEAHTKSGGADTQVADGTYNKLEIRFICNAALTDEVISVDYVAIGGYNKDAVLCNGTNASSSVIGADEKPALISGLNIGGKSYALNETANGYTVCEMSSGYESLGNASVTATAAAGWTVLNTVTNVTNLTNCKVLDAAVTATNGTATKTVSYRYVFHYVEATGDATFSTTTYRVATEVNDKSVGDDGSFGDPTAWSYDGTPQDTFFPIRRYSSTYASNAGGGRDENIGITTFDFSASKDFADQFVVSYNMWAGTNVIPSVYLVPDNATNISDCTLLGTITPKTVNAWAYADFDVTTTVQADADGIITLGIYIPDADYATMSNRALQIQHGTGTRQSFAYGAIAGIADLANVPNNTDITAKRTVVEGTVADPLSITPIIAKYNSGSLIDVTIGAPVTGLNGSAVVISVALDNFSYESGDSLKVFYWSSMTELTPVLDVQSIE